MSLEYARNADGEVTSVTSKDLPGEEKPKSEYDAESRLTKNAGLTYAYDLDDRPTRNGSNYLLYSPDDQLEDDSHAAYYYDFDGDRTSRVPESGPRTTYGYDQAENLTSVNRAASESIPAISDTYAYNGEALRASETIAGNATYLTWNPTASTPLLLSDGTNSYIYGPTGAPVEQISKGEVALFYHHDQQGSTRMLTNGDGEVDATMTYDAYGAETGTTGTATTPLGYDAQYTSADTGLIYMRARTYDPTTAQFLSVDPLAAMTGEPYAYAGGNPVSNVDPTGTELCTFGYCLGWHPVNPAKAVANFGAGFANAVVSTATLGNVHIPAPFCGSGLNWSYEIGGITAGAEVAVLTPAKFEEFFLYLGLGPAASPILAGGLSGSSASFVASGGEASLTQEAAGFAGGLVGGVGGNTAGSFVYTPSRAATSAAGGLVSSWSAEAALPFP